MPNLQAEVSSPGDNPFPNAAFIDWLHLLISGFWEARIDGIMSNWTCDELGNITPISPSGTDITRDLIQIVILYASWTAVRNQLRTLRTQQRSAAGPVSFEFQQSAQVLVEILRDIKTRRDILLVRLSDLGTIPVYALDAVMAKEQAIEDTDTWWIANGFGQ